ncbi:MAG: cation-translocating P-type ATPase [Nitrospiria bacterium]
MKNNSKGLTAAEAGRLLKEEGYNELPTDQGKNILSLLYEILREPMFVLLIAAGTVYMFLGDLMEALILLFSIFIIIAITLYQKSKVERVLDTLKNLTSPRALVIREGRRERIPGREVVRGDLLVLSEGDRVPADALLLEGSYFQVDESLLTGESVPVLKSLSSGENPERRRPEAEGTACLYSGSLVVKGRGIARVTATGAGTELGKIGKSLFAQSVEETPLQREIRNIIKYIAIAVFLICAFVVVVYALIQRNWYDGILAGITLAMAILPEEFPVVLTIFLAIGAWRISRENVLTRSPSAIEALGSATVLCVDKTGTLTQNKMEIQALFSEGETIHFHSGKTIALPDNFHTLIEYGILSSQSDPFDPMEKAFQDMGAHGLKNTEHLHSDWILEHEYSLGTGILAMSHVWRSPDGGSFVVASKGAPEAIIDLCHINESARLILESEISRMAQKGLRVLGVARALYSGAVFPSLQHDFDFEFIGLVGLADPIRPGVSDAIRQCREAGIRVVMITGDFPETARAIAREAGLLQTEEILTGADLDQIPEASLKERIKSADIFARIRPEQKLKLVRLLKSIGLVVAMTGDGVNDAPALKGADIGVAMGMRGTDVAREAASLVLLDDNFNSIVQAVRLGRRIFDNLKKAMSYLVAVHIPIAGMSLVPLILGWPMMFFPVHIVFMEFIIDPASSIIFEAEEEEKGVMKRPPRKAGAPLFQGAGWFFLLLQGFSVLAIVLLVYGWGLGYGPESVRNGDGGADRARALAFTVLIVSNLFMILANRSLSEPLWKVLQRPNRALWWVIGGTSVFLALVLYLPGLIHLFRFAPLTAGEVIFSMAMGAISILWFEALKQLAAKG